MLGSCNKLISIIEVCQTEKTIKIFFTKKIFKYVKE